MPGLLGNVPNYGLLDVLQRHSMETRRDGNAIKNEDGSVSTTRSGSVNDPRLNNGAATLIPFVYEGREVPLKEAIERAVAAGVRWPAFPDHDIARAYSMQASQMMRPLSDVARDMGQFRSPNPAQGFDVFSRQKPIGPPVPAPPSRFMSVRG